MVVDMAVDIKGAWDLNGHAVAWRVRTHNVLLDQVVSNLYNRAMSTMIARIVMCHQI